MCENCQKDIREAWGPINEHPDLKLVSKGNYIFLKQCDSCSQYWVESSYEPYLSFTYLVKWPYGKGEWEYAPWKDDGITLLKWHKQAIKEYWNRFPNKDVAAIIKHRERSYYSASNPIDATMNDKIILEKIIKPVQLDDSCNQLSAPLQADT